MAKIQTNEPDRLISAAIGLALPNDKEGYGYLSEFHAYGETAKASGDYAEDLAVTMLAATLGIELDPQIAWDERRQLYKASGRIFKTRQICQAAKGDRQGLWTTAVAAAVLIP